MRTAILCSRTPPAALDDALMLRTRPVPESARCFFCGEDGNLVDHGIGRLACVACGHEGRCPGCEAVFDHGRVGRLPESDALPAWIEDDTPPPVTCFTSAPESWSRAYVDARAILFRAARVFRPRAKTRLHDAPELPHEPVQLTFAGF